MESLPEAFLLQPRTAGEPLSRPSAESPADGASPASERERARVTLPELEWQQSPSPPSA